MMTWQTQGNEVAYPHGGLYTIKWLLGVLNVCSNCIKKVKQIRESFNSVGTKMAKRYALGF